MLLAMGKILYFNDCNKSVKYFASIGYPNPALSNPCDYFMSIMSKESIEIEEEMEGLMSPEEIAETLPEKYKKRIDHFVTSYEASELKNEPAKMLKDFNVEPIDKDAKLSNRTHWCYEFGLLAKRNMLNQLRLPSILFVRLFTMLVMGVICILIYGGGLDETRQGVQNRNGALFFLCVNTGMTALSNISLVFPSERPVFLREANNGMYRTSSYFWSKILSEVPAAIIMPFIQAVITFFGIGFNNEYWYKFPVYFLCFLTTYNAFGGFGYILGAAISRKDVLNVLMPVIVVPTMLFAGFFVNQDNVPWFLKPVEYISIFKYAYQAFFLNEYNDFNLACMNTTNPDLKCSPLEDFNAPQTLEESLFVMLGLMLLCYLLAFIILNKLIAN